MKAQKKKNSDKHRNHRAEKHNHGNDNHAQDQRLLRQIGLRINKDLHDTNKPVEWLSFETGVARSTLREIIAGRSNLRVLTLRAICRGLGYKSISEFLNAL